MTPLAAHLRRLIALQGPVPFARFMAEALGNPVHGYYMRKMPFGVSGDFTTAPEISQMFGELIGLWCLDAWQAMGEPAELNLVELGPGRGTLMADVLRAVRARQAFLEAARVQLVEFSPHLKKQQAAALAGHSVTWRERFGELPEGPLILIANEFFDALPVCQFEKTERGWCERLVDLREHGADANGFAFVLSPAPTPASALIPPALQDAAAGAVAEVCPAGISLMHTIAERTLAGPGAALIIDYGYARSAPGDSVQAVREHDRHPVLEAPGEADITAHVDFASLARTAVEAGARPIGPIEQGRFLRNLGIEMRAAKLLASADAAQRVEIAAALGRLTDPSQMGSLFKVLAVTHPRARIPAGFETET